MTDSTNEIKPVVDWAHLPTEANEISLWESLHDGKLKEVVSNRLERTVRLRFETPYLNRFHNLPEGTYFHFTLSGVKSGRVSIFVPWTGEFSVPKGISYEESEKLRAEFFANGRYDSGSWDEFESKFSTGGQTAEIYDAKYALAVDGGFAIKLELQLDDETYPELALSSEAVAIQRSDGQTISLREFLSLGEAYWEDFADRGRMKRASAEATGSGGCDPASAQYP